ncbi:MAG: zinc ribbon domain-containing protein [Promethearchaeota archaeon]
MTDFKDYIWVFPLVGGILIILGLLTPVAYVRVSNVGEYYWLWGLFFAHVGSSTHTEWIFEMEPQELSPAIFLYFLINFVIFLILAIGIIKSANNARKEKETQQFEKSWLTQGIAFIILAVLFIILTEIIMYAYYDKIGYPGTSFWENWDPGFAIIAPFLSGGLIIAGVVISKYVPKREGVTPIKEKALPKTEVSTIEVAKTLSFCPECGQKIRYSESKFCTSCGFEFPNH